MSDWEIKKGDRVAVHFNGAPLTLSHDAIVRRIPQATGDSWVFECQVTGRVHWVSEGCTITKLEYRLPPPPEDK